MCVFILSITSYLSNNQPRLVLVTESISCTEELFKQKLPFKPKAFHVVLLSIGTSPSFRCITYQPASGISTGICLIEFAINLGFLLARLHPFVLFVLLLREINVSKLILKHYFMAGVLIV